ncbi:MAG TPA: hypothetical protein VF735_08985 [Pyrinomonadaceae bacterium]|jgi:hypothetical protein
MSTVNVDGKPISLPSQIVEAGVPAIRAALAAEIPTIENAEITIERGITPGAAPSVSVVKRGQGKGALSQEQEELVAVLERAPKHVNPAIRLAAEAMRAEAMGDTGFMDGALRRGEVERALIEGEREGRAVSKTLVALIHAAPSPSNKVPVGF